MWEKDAFSSIYSSFLARFNSISAGVSVLEIPLKLSLAVKMLLLHSRKLLSFLLALPNVCHCTPSSVCKPLPGEANWPGATAWEALNSSVSGRLLATIPPGSVCHPELVQYDFSACAVLPSQWTNGTFVALNPVTSDYNDVTCLPAPNTTCSAAGYPTYVIQASCPRDVQAGVEFARDTGVRLIVKGTGHDYPGR